MRNAEEPVVSVVIPASNERRTIVRVIHEAFRVHPQTEVIVVVNGATDGTYETASRTGAKVLQFPQPLGHDVGRSIGAAEARGRIVLFTDADLIIPARDLRPFVDAVAGGADIALNNYSGPTRTRNVHSVVLAKHALNIALRRDDLGGASMTAIPHALSRRALEAIGCDSLMVPPLALTKAVTLGLAVRTVHFVPVGRLNRRRGRALGRRNPLEQLIVGDHLEAIEWLAAHSGERGGWTDLTRDRRRVMP